MFETSTEELRDLARPRTAMAKMERAMMSSMRM
jgi:hypothetical protein